MHATPFDFDVITGPSVPRDDRKQEPEPGSAGDQSAGTPPLQPPAR